MFRSFFAKFLFGAGVSVTATVELANIVQSKPQTLDQMTMTVGVVVVCISAIASFIYWATTEHAMVKNDIASTAKHNADQDQRLARQSDDMAGLRRLIEEVKSTQDVFMAAHTQQHQQIADTLAELKDIARSRK